MSDAPDDDLAIPRWLYGLIAVATVVVGIAAAVILRRPPVRPVSVVGMVPPSTRPADNLVAFEFSPAPSPSHQLPSSSDVEPAPSTPIAAREVPTEIPSFSVYKEDLYESGLKTQVTIRLVVSGHLTEAGLRELLLNLCRQTAARTGFKYDPHPTRIFIRAYTSPDRAEAEMGTFVAMVDKYRDEEPRVTFNRGVLSTYDKPPVVKFGLSEARREEIWKDCLRACDLARREAEQIHPTRGLVHPTQKDFSDQLEIQDGLTEKYEAVIAEREGLTKEQLDDISVEAFKKGWPPPP